MMGVSSPGKSYLDEQFAHFHFDEFEQFGVVDHVGLVHVDDDVGHANLTGQQDVLAGLRHGAVSGGHDQDGAVHLGSTGDHVLDVVGVARAVNVGVVTVGGFVFDVGGVDGDAARLFFRRASIWSYSLASPPNFFDRTVVIAAVKRGLAMVNVSNRANVYVRFRTFKFFLCHFQFPISNLEANYFLLITASATFFGASV